MTRYERTIAIIMQAHHDGLERPGRHVPSTGGYQRPDGEFIWQATCEECGWSSPRRATEFEADWDRLNHAGDSTAN